MSRKNSMFVIVGLSLLAPALAGGAIITTTVDLTVSAIPGQTMDGLAAQATFWLDTASPSTLVITLKNTSTGAPFGTDSASQILTALSFDMGVAGPKITGGSAVIGLGGTSIDFDDSPVLSAGANVSAEWGYGNDGATNMLPNLLSCMSAHTTRMATGNLDGSPNGELDGPQGGVVTNPPVVSLGGLGAIADSVVATLSLDKDLSDLSFLANGVLAEFGSDYRFAKETPPPTKVSLQILKFHDSLNAAGIADGILNGTELALGAGWEFDVSGGDIVGAPIHLVTDASGLVAWELTDGVTYLVTEVGMPAGYAGWWQTTNNGNPIPVTMNGNTSLNVGNIPEPATLSVLVLGGIAALLRRRR